MNKLKNQRGSITIITLVTVLFMLAFALGNFAIVMSRRQAQASTINAISTIYTDDNNSYNPGDLPKIPEGFVVSRNPSELNIREGLVIYRMTYPDSSPTDPDSLDWSNMDSIRKTYDQFVWIPIKQIYADYYYPSKMFICESKTGSGNCSIRCPSGNMWCSAHNTSDKICGRLYSTGINQNMDMTTINGDNYEQTQLYSNTLREPAIVVGTNTAYDTVPSYIQTIATITGENYTATNFESKLKSDYLEIAKAISVAGGFWVGRYETSGMVNGVASSFNVANMKVKAGQTTGISSLTWYSAYAEQKQYVKSINSNYVGGMITGAAYDQIMLFIEAQNVTNNVSHSLTAPYATGGIGYSAGVYNDKFKNIYDLEGNVQEMTTEAFFNSSGKGISRVVRGGAYNTAGTASATYRHDITPITNSPLYGSRMILIPISLYNS